MLKADIATRNDIAIIINNFYEKVRKDDHLAVIFNDVIRMDWDHHIPVIIDFWETILLDADLYRKNAMEPHFAINKLYPLQAIHFQKWLQLFTQTIDEHFAGAVADTAKMRAKSIAGIMELKMNNINNGSNELDIKKL